MRNLAVLLALSLLLAACGGGGGMEPPSAPPPPPPPEDPPDPDPPPEPEPDPDENFDTEEFRNSTGLDNINVIPAFEQGGTGAGITVGIVDTGVDSTHPDLRDNVSPASIDIIDSRGNPEDEDGHGTIVAGIIAAARNDRAVVGVAFESTVLSVRADEPDSCGSEDDCSFSDVSIAGGIRRAVENGARVVNLSLGGEAFGFRVFDAINFAAQNDVVVVISAGNDGEVDPSGFAQVALEPEVANHVIIVGATDQQNNLADFSNNAGNLAQSFLVAPGVGIQSTFPAALSDGVCDGPGDVFCVVTSASGTSFSAPHVAGAVALLAQMFPGLTGAEIRELLLMSALDLGDPGTDAVFGNGLLDIGAALQPIGTTSLPADADGNRMVETADASLVGSAVFGDAFAGSALLNDLVMTDRFGRSFSVDMSGGLVARPDSLNLFGLVDVGQRLDGPGLTLGETARLSLSAYRDRRAPVAANLSSYDQAMMGQDRPVAYFARRLDESTDFAMSWGLGPAALLESAAAGGGFTRGYALSHRMDTDLMGTGADQAMRIGRRLGAGLRLDLAVAHDENEPDAGVLPTPQAETLSRLTALARLSGVHGPLQVSLTLGETVEDGSFLGALSSGPLALGDGARTHIAGLDAAVELPGGWRLLGRYLTGLSRATGARSALISDISRVRTESWTLGLERYGLFRASDRLGLIMTAPLRAMGGRALFSLPVGRDFTAGRFLFEDRRLTLSPTGRERDFELSYSLRPAPWLRLDASAIYRIEPGHVAQAADSAALFLRARLGF